MLLIQKVRVGLEEMRDGCVSLEVVWGSSRCTDDTLNACSSCVDRCGHHQRLQVRTYDPWFGFSWNSSLNLIHIKSITVEIRSSRETNRERQVVRKTPISLVAGSHLDFVTLPPSWLAVVWFWSCLHLCDPPLPFVPKTVSKYIFLFIYFICGWWKALALFSSSCGTQRREEYINVSLELCCIHFWQRNRCPAGALSTVGRLFWSMWRLK